MPAALDPQLALDERAVTDPELEAKLEQRLRLRQDVAEVRGTLKNVDEEVQAGIKSLGLTEDQIVRIGRFRISLKAVAERHVEFNAEATTRVSIVLADD